jgi:hypothetical protein
MGALTLIGAAAACSEFCRLLFEDPLKAAELLNVTLTRGELEDLQKVFNDEIRDELCGHLKEVANLLCHHPPCTFAPVIPGKENLCKDEAA